MANTFTNQATEAVFRTPRWIVVRATLGTALFPLASWSLYVAEGLSVLFFAATVLCLFAVAGLGDALTSRVVINGDELEIVVNFQSNTYLRSEFSTVTWAKGSPISLKRRDGSWLKLPPVGPNAQGVANSLRAWLVHQRVTATPGRPHRIEKL